MFLNLIPQTPKSITLLYTSKRLHFETLGTTIHDKEKQRQRRRKKERPRERERKKLGTENIWLFYLLFGYTAPAGSLSIIKMLIRVLERSGAYGL